MSSTPLSDQVALSTVSERDWLHTLPMGSVYLYCYCNHIYSIILQRASCRGISEKVSVCNEPVIANGLWLLWKSLLRRDRFRVFLVRFTFTFQVFGDHDISHPGVDLKEWKVVPLGHLDYL